MDPSLTQPTPSVVEEDDEWDTEGFVIPSLAVEDSDVGNPDASKLTDLKPPEEAKAEEKIYLGPHGAPPSQAKQQELNTAGRKQRFKHKLKEADRKFAGTARENKVENIRELMGGRTNSSNASKGSHRDWLDPHCHESQFNRYSH